MLNYKFPYQFLLADENDDSFRIKDIMTNDGVIGCCWIDLDLKMAIIFHENDEDDLDDRIIGYAKFLELFGIDKISYFKEDSNDVRNRSPDGLYDEASELYDEYVSNKNKNLNAEEKMKLKVIVKK